MDLMSAAQLLGNVGEFVGAVAVVVTLAYLVVQIRQNTRSINSNNNHSVMGAFNHFNEVLATNTELTQLFYEGMSRPESLSEADRHRFWHLAALVMNIFRNLYYQFVEGTFPRDQWMVQAREARQLMNTPGIAYFRSVSSSFEPLFEYLEELPADEPNPLSDRFLSLGGNSAPVQ